jgi:hypothetical protein
MANAKKERDLLKLELQEEQGFNSMGSCCDEGKLRDRPAPKADYSP